MTDTKICQFCGATIAADAVTCIMCGSPTTSPPSQTVISPETPPSPEIMQPAYKPTPTTEYQPPQPDLTLPEPTPESASPPEQPAVVITEPAKSPSNRGLAVIVETAAGIFGFLGIGWMISGKLLTGILLLFGYWLFLVGYVVLVISQINATNGWILLSCCFIPVLPLISGLVLNWRSK